MYEPVPGLNDALEHGDHRNESGMVISIGTLFTGTLLEDELEHGVSLAW
jgi:hypothetical protein